MRKSHLAFSSALAIAIAMALFALASAQPIQDIPANPKAPVVGKVQMRDKLIPLSRDTLSEGGEARDLVRGTAQLIGDVEPKPKAQPAKTSH